MCIRPIMIYGYQIWPNSCAKTYLKKLQIIQQDLMKYVTSNLTQRLEVRNSVPNYDLIRNL